MLERVGVKELARIGGALTGHFGITSPKIVRYRNAHSKAGG
jgi:hypothetical protein